MMEATLFLKLVFLAIMLVSLLGVFTPHYSSAEYHLVGFANLWHSDRVQLGQDRADGIADRADDPGKPGG